MQYVAFLLCIVFLIRCAEAAQAIDVSVSQGLGCGVYDDGSVYCWGDFPRLASDEAIRITELPPAVSIATGRFGGCAIDHQSLVRCWGLDYQRSVAEGKNIVSMKPFPVHGLPRVKSVSLGFGHFCALSLEGEIWCWGDNPCGEIGCGDKEFKPSPVQVALPLPAISLSTGVNNTCAVLNTGQVSCWGSDNPTRSGMPFVYESTEPIFLDPFVVGLFKQVANGRNFACGITVRSKVTCWGSNIMGQIGAKEPRISGGLSGIGEVDNIDDAVDLDASYFFACAVEQGKVICWGNPSSVGKTGVVEGIENATRVGAGTQFACAVDAGSIKCWGQPLYEGMSPTNPVSVPGLPDH